MKLQWWNNLPVYAPEGEGQGGAAEPAEPTSETPAAPTPPAKSGLSEEVSRIFDWDPFEPGDEPGEREGGTPSPRSPGQETEEGGDDEVPPQSQTSVQGKKEEPSKVDPVQAQLAALTQLMRERQQQQPQPQQTAEEKPKGPRFNWNVPEQIVTAISSEDIGERSAGVNALVNGLANAMYVEIRRELDEERRGLIQAIPRLAQETVSIRDQQRAIHDDFYGRFSDLPRTPEIYRFVQLTAQQMAQELGPQFQGWNEQFREALGQRIYTTFGRQVPPRNGANGNGAVTPTGRPAAKPRYVAGAGTRGNSGLKAPNADIQDLWDTMDYS